MSFHLYQNRAKEPQMLTMDFLHEMMSECVSQPVASSGQLTDPGRGVPGLPLLVLYPGCAVGTTSLHLDPKMLAYHCCFWIVGLVGGQGAGRQLQHSPAEAEDAAPRMRKQSRKSTSCKM